MVEKLSPGYFIDTWYMQSLSEIVIFFIIFHAILLETISFFWGFKLEFFVIEIIKSNMAQQWMDIGIFLKSSSQKRIKASKK